MTFMNLYQDQAYQEVPHLHLLWINAPLHIKDIIWGKCTTPHQTHHLDHVQTISLYLNLYDFMNLYQDQAYQEVLHLHLLWINAPLHIKDIISDIQSSPGINAPLHIKHIISDIQSSPACNLCQHPHLLLLWEILVFFAISLLGWKLKSCIGILPRDSD